MGAWGYGLYQNDSASDMKSIFKDEYEKNKEVEELEEIMKKKFKFMLKDEEDAPNFWCILADLEWRYGILTENTKKIVLDFLEKGGDIEFWKETEGDSDAKKRKNVLDKLEEKIKSPQPPKKRITKKRPYVCKWNIGDIFAYKLTQKHSENTEYYGKYVVFQVLDKYVNIDENTMPYVHVANEIFDKIPLLNEFDKYSYFQTSQENIEYKIGFYSLERSRSFKKENLHYIGNRKVIKEIHIDSNKLNRNCAIYNNQIFWHFFDFGVINYFKLNNRFNYEKKLEKIKLYQYKLYNDKISEKIRAEFRKLFINGIDSKEAESILHENYITYLSGDEEKFKRIMYDNKFKTDLITEEEKKEMFSYIEKEEFNINSKLKKGDNILLNVEDGDIFAYKLNSEEFKNTKYYDKYILIHKFENDFTPINELKHHIRICKKIFSQIPELDYIKKSYTNLYKFFDDEKKYHMQIYKSVKDNISYDLYKSRDDNISYDLYVNIESKKLDKRRLFKIGNANIYINEFTYEEVNIENFDIYLKGIIEYNEIIDKN